MYIFAIILESNIYRKNKSYDIVTYISIYEYIYTICIIDPVIPQFMNASICNLVHNQKQQNFAFTQKLYRVMNITTAVFPAMVFVGFYTLASSLC